ncbi:MAG TPA: hypothetical protein PLG59_00195 [bacterium]|nr:hypothetical protein [bacterium]HQO33049.1 hypothetical protein [bacterium]
MRKKSLFFFLLVAISSSHLIAEIVVSERKPLLKEVSLGTPVVAHTLWGSVVARDPVDRHPLLVTGTWSAGGDAPVFIFDFKSNTLERVPVDTQGTYGLVQGPDGWIYIGTVTDGSLYRYHLEKKTLENLGRPAPTEVWLYNLVNIDNRYILGGTYGGGRLAGFDLQKGELVDFGAMNPPECYVSGTAPGPNGTVYCGIASHAQLVHFNPQTGERTKLLPEQYLENSFVNQLLREGPYLYALLLFDNRIIVFDTRTNEMIRDFGPGSSMIGTDGVVWVNAAGTAGRWNFEKGEWIETIQLPPGTRDISSEGIAFTYQEGLFAAVDLTTGKIVGQAEVGAGGNGQDVFALHTGPDGSVYGSSYNLHHIFRTEIQTGITTDLGNPIPPQSGEVYAFANSGSLMYMASYTYARLSVYDTSKEWNPGVNPRLLGELGHEQYRTPGLVIGPDEKLYIGSIPAYGKIGGALSIYDPETDRIEVFRNIIPNQSIACLISDTQKNRILGGSWIIAGGGVDSPERDAHLFAWDCAEKRLVADLIPVPGSGIVNHLHLLPDGTVLAACGDRLIQVDSEIGKVLRNDPGPGGGITGIASFAGTLYTNSGAGLLSFDPDTWSATKIGHGGVLLTFDALGHAYYARGPELLRTTILSIDQPGE